MQHEMTHAYGAFDHSYAGDFAYGDPWDVLSNAIAYYGDSGDPIYGKIGQHTQAYNRYYLDWIPQERVLTVGSGQTTVTLERTTQPGPNGYLMAKIPLGRSSHYYTVEARRRVGYDSHLLGDSITIHEIGGDNHQIQLVDAYASGNNYGKQVWKVGDAWTAPKGGIIVHVDAMTSTGFVISIQTGLEIRSLTLSAVSDTTIEAPRPSVNFGSNLLLKSKLDYDPASSAAKVALLDFGIEAVPVNIANARLRLTLSEGQTLAGSPRASYLIMTPKWTESGLTWASAGASVQSLPEPHSFAHTTETANILEWDLTGIVAMNGPNALTSILIDNAELNFSSREGADPPQLIIDYLVPATAVPSQTLLPTNDTYVREATPTNMFGSKTVLNVMNAAKDQISYVKFNLNSLPATLTKATLRLYGTNAGPDGGGVYAVGSTYLGTNTQWLETGLKWTTAPAISGTALGQLGRLQLGTGSRWM